MAEETQKVSRWSKLKDTYRLVILNEETFEERGSYRLSALNMYLLISTLIVIISALVLALFFFTPLKRLIPGYNKVDNSEMIGSLNEQVTLLEDELLKQKLQTNSLRQMLTENVEALPTVEEQLTDVPIEKQEVEIIPPIAEEAAIRDEIRQMQQGGTQLTDLRAINTIRKLPEELYFLPPVSGPISAGFMPDKKHYGVDVLAPKNTPVKAVMDGFVTFSDWTLETGHTICIQHDNNIVSYYKHNSMLLKDVNDFIRAGEAIAIIGNTGTLSSGPHLHFELWHEGKPLDPARYVNF